MITFDFILQGHEATEENARDHARGQDWQSIETTEQRKTEHSRFFDTVNGIDIYYDFGADYYYFVERDEFKIFEGYDHLNQYPLFKVTGVNNEFIGEWHTDNSAAEQELKELNN